MSPIIPRLSVEEMHPLLAQRLRPRVERLGYLGEFFRCAAQQPKALLAFLDLTEALKESLPDRLTEVVALTISSAMDNAYERVQHERLCLKLGFGEDWIRRVEARGDKAELAEDERLVQRLVVAVLERKGHNTTRELEEMVRSIGPERTIAILMLVGRYVSHALMVNSLALEPPVPSPLEVR